MRNDPGTDNVELGMGMQVHAADGGKVGKIVGLDNSQIVVEKGFFFPSDHAIPISAVDSADDDNVYLRITKDEALNQKWDSSGSYADSTSVGSTTGLAASRMDDTKSADRMAAGRTSTVAGGNDTINVPVHAEELSATKRSVDAGRVTINKDVVSEERTLEVPITEERVRVTRRAVNRDATGGDAFQGGTIEVPVRTEQVDMQKRVRVAEEVEVAKEAVQKTRQVTGTVRREVVDVQDDSRVDVSDATAITGKTDKGR